MNRTRYQLYLASLVFVAALGLIVSGCDTNHSGPPRIAFQPANQTASVGEGAVFGVTAHGKPPLQYQWRKNGQDLYAATYPNYSTGPVAAADNGAKYDVVITNSLGSVTSSSATLTVKVPPAPPPPPEKKPEKKKPAKKKPARRRHR
ncbi:MAG TPA: hypothetical protein VFW94_16005 [Candidatus Acidoferrales bacterium]|nr:hypothetical protein [Candidatus Acidoferrales bacterium]